MKEQVQTSNLCEAISENKLLIESIIPAGDLQEISQLYRAVFYTGKEVNAFLLVPVSMFAFQPTDINSIKIDCETHLVDYIKNAEHLRKIINDEFAPIVEKYKTMMISLLKKYTNVTETQLSTYCRYNQPLSF